MHVGKIVDKPLETCYNLSHKPSKGETMRTVTIEKNSGFFSGDPLCGEWVGDDYTCYVIDEREDGTKAVYAYYTAVAKIIAEDRPLSLPEGDETLYCWEEMFCEWTEDADGNLNEDDKYEYGEGSYKFFTTEEAAQEEAYSQILNMEKNHEKYILA